MKKIVSFLICVLLITAFFSSSVLAANTDQPAIHSAKTVFEDGSYCITTITESQENVKIGFIGFAVRSIKTASKTTAYYNANGQAVFSATVTGTFSYNGSSATATSAKYSYSIADSAWRFVSGSAGCSGNTATASCKFKHGSLYSNTLSVSLSCSPSGVLS